MTLKTMMLAGATLAVLAAPAAAMAQGWDHDRDHYRYDRDHDGWRDRDHDGWRRGWDRDGDRGYAYGYGRGYGYAYGHRQCWTENRGFYNWYGRYEYRAVEVCR